MEIQKFSYSKLPSFKTENEKENEMKKHEKILQKDLCPNLIFLQLFYSPSGYQLQHPAILIEENEVGNRKIHSDNQHLLNSVVFLLMNDLVDLKIT